VGTGLGPTLEFYALVSRELQRCDLTLWNDSDSYKHQLQSSSIVDVVKTTSHLEDDILTSRTTTNVSSNNTANEQQLSVVVNQDLNIVSADGSLMLIEQSDSLIINATQANSAAPAHQPTGTAGQQQHGVMTYVNAPMGLFPIPLSKTAKTSQISRIKNKFKFLGKFMAKAVMDSRMVSAG
jgi:E3 ubiquitin-protein ligase TRIP12